ncbi:MAG: glycyl-radical enzyme activating protein [Desulfobacter sp.]|nr:glycyl-radical enzyme activating protein [Desulfobacter sp.]
MARRYSGFSGIPSMTAPASGPLCFFRAAPCPVPGAITLKARQWSRLRPGLVHDLVREIEKDIIYYDESNGGVTFSGGEPLSRPRLLMDLIRACREKHIHTCLDTSGFAPATVIESAAKAVDLVLYDIKIFDEKIHDTMIGKSSRIIFSNLEMLDKLAVPLKLRFPLIPSMTDSDENITQLIEFLVSRTGYRDIHILPFHNTGADKYRQMNLKYPLEHIRPPENHWVEAVALRFKKNGFSPVIGG